MSQLHYYESRYRRIALIVIAAFIGAGYGYAFFDILPVYAAKVQKKAAEACAAPKPVVTPVSNTRDLRKVMNKYNYDFKAVTKGQESVPRLYCSNLPKDFKAIRSSRKKREMFLQIMLPMILRVNEQILSDRHAILQLKARMQRYGALKSEDAQRLQNLCARYKLSYRKRPNFDELLKRVDLIPPSLALAQSIIESGWGDSKAARIKNSPFGISPAERVAFYQTLYDSVDAYMHTINTHLAYKNMRRTRSLLRQRGNAISGDYLASDLTRYSILKEVYVGKLQTVIKQHNLKKFDALQLRHASYVM
jgi:Bax protein